MLSPDISVFADLRETVWFPLWRYGCYPHQLAEDQLCLKILCTGDFVWDIGANIGYTALIFAKAVGERGDVIAIEPSRKTFPMLERTVSGISCIKAIRVAVSDKVGEIPFTDRFTLDTSSVTPKKGESTYLVPCTTLDTLYNEYNHRAPQFIKIDVEGHEYTVLQGGKNLIRSCCPLIEFEALTDAIKKNIIQVLSDISGNRYKFYRIACNGKLASWTTKAGNKVTNNFIALTESHLPRFNDVDIIENS